MLHCRAIEFMYRVINDDAMPTLNPEQKQYLRRLGHDLKPVVRTGSAGLTDAVMAEVEIALDHHELIKVKLVTGDRDQRHAFARSICERANAALVQSVGQIILLYRANPKKKTGRIAIP